MDDVKRILVFSDAGGTGRSYHADLSARNQRLRVHYLLEAGWKADAAIQGLGRTNRTNQAQPPLFRPIATNVKAEKRFLSTIARRLDTLGAITKGQRQTGGQGLFRAEDNLESHYARDALRQLYLLLVDAARSRAARSRRFEDATGLKLTDANGIRDELPPITTFLNRLLALTIDLQNILFAAFEQLLDGADRGRDRVRHLRCRPGDADGRELHRHRPADRSTRIPAPAPRRRLLTITQRERNRPVTLDDALDHRRRSRAPCCSSTAVRPRRRAGAGAQRHARRRRRSNAACGCPADGASGDGARCHVADPLAGGRRDDVRARLGGRARRRAGVHRQRDPYRRRPAVADLEAPAE